MPKCFIEWVLGHYNYKAIYSIRIYCKIMNWLYYAMMGHIELYLLYNSVFYWPYCTMMNSIIMHHIILCNKVSYCTVYCHFEQWYLCIFLCLVGGAGCTIWPLSFSSTFRKSMRVRQQHSQRILQYLLGKEGLFRHLKL